MIGAHMNNLLYRAKRLQARLELRFRCPKCPVDRRKSRDILGQGDCFWRANWSKGRYDLRSYRAHVLLKLMGIEKSPYLE